MVYRQEMTSPSVWGSGRSGSIFAIRWVIGYWRCFFCHRVLSPLLSFFRKLCDHPLLILSILRCEICYIGTYFEISDTVPPFKIRPMRCSDVDMKWNSGMWGFFLTKLKILDNISFKIPKGKNYCLDELRVEIHPPICPPDLWPHRRTNFLVDGMDKNKFGHWLSKSVSLRRDQFYLMTTVLIILWLETTESQVTEAAKLPMLMLLWANYRMVQ
jgi:hypothetical protein